MTTRQTPVGVKLGDGYQSLVTFELDPDISLWEKEVTPVGLDAGEGIDTTTMWNTTVRTKQPQALFDTTESGCSCAYDPRVWPQLLAMVRQNQKITQTFPDGSRVEFYAFLQSAVKSALKIGEQPTVDIKIGVTNTHPTTGDESVPHWYGVGCA